LWRHLIVRPHWSVFTTFKHSITDDLAHTSYCNKLPMNSFQSSSAGARPATDEASKDTRNASEHRQ
jgi:hypothetical protein